MKKPDARLRQRRRGAVIVELTLVMLVTFFLVIAILDFGQLLFFHQVMTERASYGARWAVVNSFDPADTTNVKNAVIYNTPTPSDTANPLFGLQSSMVTVTPLPSATDLDFVQVRIDYPVQFLTPGIWRSFTPSFRAVRAVESLGATD
jgi:Flp pilus assembly protein TadG